MPRSACGVASGLGVGVGAGVGVGLGVGSAVGLGVGVGDAVGLAVGVGVGVASGVALGVGLALATGSGWGLARATRIPPLRSVRFRVEPRGSIRAAPWSASRNAVSCSMTASSQARRVVASRETRTTVPLLP